MRAGANKPLPQKWYTALSLSASVRLSRHRKHRAISLLAGAHLVSGVGAAQIFVGTLLFCRLTMSIYVVLVPVIADASSCMHAHVQIDVLCVSVLSPFLPLYLHADSFVCFPLLFSSSPASSLICTSQFCMTLPCPQLLVLL
jgi:hypothetical protein